MVALDSTRSSRVTAQSKRFSLTPAHPASGTECEERLQEGWRVCGVALDPLGSVLVDSWLTVVMLPVF
jgi:hypothetical protein